MNRFIPLALAAVLSLVALPFIFNRTSTPAIANTESILVMCSEGGRLEALDADGLTLGPCVLKHTDVKAVVQGHFIRVTLTQKYHNPHADKIEALYTFPLSHRSAVDRMNMVIGDRIIIGQVKEREAAREMYESAKDAGRIASLLDQERPNIFTQSIANIDPGANIDIEISYVETLEATNGEYSFAFPTVVSPRYIPGAQDADPRQIRHPQADGKAPPPPRSPNFTPRRGIILSAPAEIRLVAWKDELSKSQFHPSQFSAAIRRASPITLPNREPDSAPVSDDSMKSAETSTHAQPAVLFQFDAIYPDGTRDRGEVLTDFTGTIGNRAFYLPQREESWKLVVESPTTSTDESTLPARTTLSHAPNAGEPFFGRTDQVPDAHRITPTPARPPLRAGHDLSITVDIDTGGSGLTEVLAPLHQTTRQDIARRVDGLASRATITLANQAEIPNRDFVLTWKQTADVITDGVFTSRTRQGDFFAVILNPPARVPDAQAVPRELIFVLDTSGSMNGKPIDKAKAVAAKMIETMRYGDTFNFITFAGRTQVLWPVPRTNTDANRAEALAFFSSQRGGGGTEMMTAINAALEQEPASGLERYQPRALTLEELVNLPADGRLIRVNIPADRAQKLASAPHANGEVEINVRPGLNIRVTDCHIAINNGSTTQAVTLEGTWQTTNGDRSLTVQAIRLQNSPPINPLRIVVFLTDGKVGNDMAIIDAVKNNRGTTRVFSFGIGNSINRYLLSEMARQGGGAAEFIYIPHSQDDEARATLDRDARLAAKSLHERTRTPVLTNISVEYSPNLSVADLEPAPGFIPDLFDVQPLVLLGRCTQPGTGFITIRGTTGSGPWERTLKLSFEAAPQANDQPSASVGGKGVVATLWARARIDAIMNAHLTEVQQGTLPEAIRSVIVQIGENFGILSQFTSFVAVDYQRVTIDGKARLVRVPIELPDQTSWESYFCSENFQMPPGVVEQLGRSREDAANRDDDNEMSNTPPESKLMRHVPINAAPPASVMSESSRPADGRRSAKPGTSKPSENPPPMPGNLTGASTPTMKTNARQLAPSAGSPAKTLEPTSAPPPSPSMPYLKVNDSATPSPTGMKSKDTRPTIQRDDGSGAPSTIDTQVHITKTETSERKVIVLDSEPGSSFNPNQFGGQTIAGVKPPSPLNEATLGLNQMVWLRHSGTGARHEEAAAILNRLYGFLGAYESTPSGGAADAQPTIGSSTSGIDGTSISSQLDPSAASATLSSRRFAPLVAAKLITTSLRVSNTDAAQRIRDRFASIFPESGLLMEAIALVPAINNQGSTQPATPTPSDTAGTNASATAASATDPAKLELAKLELVKYDQLDQRIAAAAMRERNLLQRLDRSLYTLLTDPTSKLASAARNTQPILISILVTEVTDSTVKQLERAGLKFQVSFGSERMIIGTVQIADLEAVALVGNVRRIEPIDE